MPSQKNRRHAICDRARKIVADPPIPKKSSNMSSEGKRRFTELLNHSGQLAYMFIIS
jgi:hypothetical protein